MENISKWNVARRYEKKALLIAINAVASLSIFFFGYDQGVMGGVNNNRNYAELMGFGTYNPTDGVVVNKTLLQGGIVRCFDDPAWATSADLKIRSQSIISRVLWWGPC